MIACVQREGDTVTVWCDPATEVMLLPLARLGAQIDGTRAVCVYAQGQRKRSEFDHLVESAAWEIALTMRLMAESGGGL